MLGMEGGFGCARRAAAAWVAFAAVLMVLVARGARLPCARCRYTAGDMVGTETR